MTQVERLGTDDVTKRDLFFLQLERIDELPDYLQLPSRQFSCLLAWDASAVSDNQIGTMARKLIEQGGVYFCIWGPDCRRVHDIIDEVREVSNPKDESVIMTTWHQDQPLSEAIWFFLHCLSPNELYECPSALAISVGCSESSAEIREALSDPRKFTADVLASEK